MNKLLVTKAPKLQSSWGNFEK